MNENKAKWKSAKFENRSPWGKSRTWMVSQYFVACKKGKNRQLKKKRHVKY